MQKTNKFCEKVAYTIVYVIFFCTFDHLPHKMGSPSKLRPRPAVHKSIKKVFSQKG